MILKYKIFINSKPNISLEFKLFQKIFICLK